MDQFQINHGSMDDFYLFEGSITQGEQPTNINPVGQNPQQTRQIQPFPPLQSTTKLLPGSNFNTTQSPVEVNTDRVPTNFSQLDTYSDHTVRIPPKKHKPNPQPSQPRLQQQHHHNPFTLPYRTNTHHSYDNGDSGSGSDNELVLLPSPPSPTAVDIHAKNTSNIDNDQSYNTNPNPRKRLLTSPCSDHLPDIIPDNNNNTNTTGNDSEICGDDDDDDNDDGDNGQKKDNDDDGPIPSFQRVQMLIETGQVHPGSMFFAHDPPQYDCFCHFETDPKNFSAFDDVDEHSIECTSCGCYFHPRCICPNHNKEELLSMINNDKFEFFCTFCKQDQFISVEHAKLFFQLHPIALTSAIQTNIKITPAQQHAGRNSLIISTNTTAAYQLSLVDNQTNQHPSSPYLPSTTFATTQPQNPTEETTTAILSTTANALQPTDSISVQRPGRGRPKSTGLSHSTRKSPQMQEMVNNSTLQTEPIIKKRTRVTKTTANPLPIVLQPITDTEPPQVPVKRRVGRPSTASKQQPTAGTTTTTTPIPRTGLTLKGQPRGKPGPKSVKDKQLMAHAAATAATLSLTSTTGTTPQTATTSTIHEPGTTANPSIKAPVPRKRNSAAQQQQQQQQQAQLTQQQLDQLLLLQAQQQQQQQQQQLPLHLPHKSLGQIQPYYSTTSSNTPNPPVSTNNNSPKLVPDNSKGLTTNNSSTMSNNNTSINHRHVQYVMRDAPDDIGSPSRRGRRRSGVASRTNSASRKRSSSNINTPTQSFSHVASQDEHAVNDTFSPNSGQILFTLPVSEDLVEFDTSNPSRHLTTNSVKIMQTGSLDNETTQKDNTNNNNNNNNNNKITQHNPTDAQSSTVIVTTSRKSRGTKRDTVPRPGDIITTPTTTTTITTTPIITTYSNSSSFHNGYNNSNKIIPHSSNHYLNHETNGDSTGDDTTTTGVLSTSSSPPSSSPSSSPSSGFDSPTSEDDEDLSHPSNFSLDASHLTQDGTALNDRMGQSILWNLLYNKITLMTPQFLSFYKKESFLLNRPDGYIYFCLVCETPCYDPVIHSTHHEQYFASLNTRLISQTELGSLRLLPTKWQNPHIIDQDHDDNDFEGGGANMSSIQSSRTNQTEIGSQHKLLFTHDNFFSRLNFSPIDLIPYLTPIANYPELPTVSEATAAISNGIDYKPNPSHIRANTNNSTRFDLLNISTILSNNCGGGGGSNISTTTSTTFNSNNTSNLLGSSVIRSNDRPAHTPTHVHHVNNMIKNNTALTTAISMTDDLAATTASNALFTPLPLHNHQHLKSSPGQYLSVPPSMQFHNSDNPSDTQTPAQGLMVWSSVAIPTLSSLNGHGSTAASTQQPPNGNQLLFGTTTAATTNTAATPSDTTTPHLNVLKHAINSITVNPMSTNRFTGPVITTSTSAGSTQFPLLPPITTTMTITNNIRPPQYFPRSLGVVPNDLSSISFPNQRQRLDTTTVVTETPPQQHHHYHRLESNANTAFATPIQSHLGPQSTVDSILTEPKLYSMAPSLTSITTVSTQANNPTTTILSTMYPYHINALQSNTSLLNIVPSSYCDICLIRSKTASAFSNHLTSHSHRRMVIRKSKSGEKPLSSSHNPALHAHVIAPQYSSSRQHLLQKPSRGISIVVDNTNKNNSSSFDQFLIGSSWNGVEKDVMGRFTNSPTVKAVPRRKRRGSGVRGKRRKSPKQPTSGQCYQFTPLSGISDYVSCTLLNPDAMSVLLDNHPNNRQYVVDSFEGQIPISPTLQRKLLFMGIPVVLYYNYMKLFWILGLNWPQLPSISEIDSLPPLPNAVIEQPKSAGKVLHSNANPHTGNANRISTQKSTILKQSFSTATNSRQSSPALQRPTPFQRVDNPVATTTNSDNVDSSSLDRNSTHHSKTNTPHPGSNQLLPPRDINSLFAKPAMGSDTTTITRPNINRPRRKVARYAPGHEGWANMSKDCINGDEYDHLPVIGDRIANTSQMSPLALVPMSSSSSSSSSSNNRENCNNQSSFAKSSQYHYHPIQYNYLKQYPSSEEQKRSQDDQSLPGYLHQYNPSTNQLLPGNHFYPQSFSATHQYQHQHQYNLFEYNPTSSQFVPPRNRPLQQNQNNVFANKLPNNSHTLSHQTQNPHPFLSLAPTKSRITLPSLPSSIYSTPQQMALPINHNNNNNNSDSHCVSDLTHLHSQPIFPFSRPHPTFTPMPPTISTTVMTARPTVFPPANQQTASCFPPTALRPTLSSPFLPPTASSSSSFFHNTALNPLQNDLSCRNPSSTDKISASHTSLDRSASDFHLNNPLVPNLSIYHGMKPTLLSDCTKGQSSSHYSRITGNIKMTKIPSSILETKSINTQSSIDRLYNSPPVLISTFPTKPQCITTVGTLPVPIHTLSTTTHRVKNPNPVHSTIFPSLDLSKQ